MKTPHKHAELIKAWADGAEIEIESPKDGKWYPSVPDWLTTWNYRIKPEPKPDFVGYTEIRYAYSDTQKPNHNLKVTFDGETGKPIKSEVI